MSRSKNLLNRYHIAVVGGGINGICVAWLLAEHGHAVELFERDKLVSATSRASSKLLHGGLRYLENFEFRLVREALQERAWWLAHAPQLARPLPIYLPVLQGAGRTRWRLKLGLWLYDRLAGHANLGAHQRFDATHFSAQCGDLRADLIDGGFSFLDGQMDDYHLGLWAAEQARQSGATLYENTPVAAVEVDGKLHTANGSREFDWVINVAGPWAHRLLENSCISSHYQLDLVRGSHLLFDRVPQQAYLLQAPRERRVVFALPYQGRLLLGTTEQRQSIHDPIACSEQEEAYLLSVYNHYFSEPLSSDSVVERFAGVRPLIRSAEDPSKATREYALEVKGRLVSVFGGKWTTARALARQVCKLVAHAPRQPN